MYNNTKHHNIMKRLYMTIPAVAFAAVCAQAYALTPGEALAEYLATRPMRVRGAASEYTLAMRGDNDALYVYNREGKTTHGFIILDSEEGGLIGYGDGQVDPGNLPPSMKAVLKAYASSPLSARITLEAHEDIPVLLDCKWNQDAPYNDDCPVLEGQRCMTGCMATAVAQVLYHPLNRMQGRGKYDYYWEQTRGRLSFDYDANPFDYDAMLDTYTEEEPGSEAARAAVANLMHGVGVSMQMNYHYYMSGAGDIATSAGLLRNLGCDKSLRLESRDFYTEAEWDGMIYSQLATGRPMVYTGISKDGGHAFVCDGYQRRDDRNYYHINWGWGGMADGFFEIARLNPSTLGIGGGTSTDGFNIIQSAMFNIKPDEGSTDMQITFWQYGTLMPEKTTALRRGRVNMAFEGNEYFYGGGLYSVCPEDRYMVIGFKYTNVEDGTVIYQDLTEPMLFTPGDGIGGFEMPCQLFPDEDGTYICKLVMKVDGEWHDVQEELATLGDLYVTLSGNDVSFRFEDKGVRLRADFRGFPGYVVRGEKTKLTVDFLAGKEDVDTDVIPTITTESGKKLWTQSAKHLKLAYGETTTLEWDEMFTPNVRRGTYMLVLQDPEGENLVNPVKISIVTEDPNSGVCGISDGDGTEVEYITLTGQRLTHRPAPGQVVIRRQGGRSAKVVMPR